MKEPEVILPSQTLAEMEETDVMRELTQKIKIALIAHFVNAVPIERLQIDKRTKNYFAVVDHVYWVYRKNPFHDTHAMFYELCKQRVKDGHGERRQNALSMAKQMDKMLEFVIDAVKAPSRRDRENKVRAAADRLMDIGMQTDNNRALAKGAEISIKLDRLDQPESEQTDMANIAFLPTVVTTNIHEIDDTREEVSDEETKRILAKYNAYVDDKSKAIEEKVAVMEARRSPTTYPPVYDGTMGEVRDNGPLTVISVEKECNEQEN